MQRQLFFVVVKDDDGDARFFQRFEVVFNRLPLPVGEDDQIRLQRQHFFHREGADFDFTHIGEFVQFRQRLAVHLPASRRPVRPHGFREANDVIQCFFTANGEVIGVVETQHDALGGHIYFHFAAKHIFDGLHLGVGGGQGRRHDGSGKQFFQHISSCCGEGAPVNKTRRARTQGAVAWKIRQGGKRQCPNRRHRKNAA